MKKLLGTALALCLSFPVLAHAEMTMEEAGAKAIGLIEGMADIVDKDKAACDKMATDLNKYQDDNAALIKELNALKGKRTDADKEAWKKKYGDRLKVAGEKMKEGGMACGKDEKVRAAFGRMQN